MQGLKTHPFSYPSFEGIFTASVCARHCLAMRILTILWLRCAAWTHLDWPSPCPATPSEPRRQLPLKLGDARPFSGDHEVNSQSGGMQIPHYRTTLSQRTSARDTLPVADPAGSTFPSARMPRVPPHSQPPNANLSRLHRGRTCRGRWLTQSTCLLLAHFLTSGSHVTCRMPYTDRKAVGQAGTGVAASSPLLPLAQHEVPET